MINATHWLGALVGVVGTIGIMDTPVRFMIHAAAEKLSTPLTLIALVVEGQQLSGVFTGDHLSAWRAAAHLSAQRHIRWCEKPYQKVLSCAPTMYDELWTGAKAMYKLEPAVAVGGEVIIYAPHLQVVSHVHGKFIYEVGYHTLAYFLNDWERFKHIPLGVLAHSTHVRGSGAWENGVEKPNVRVTLSSQISPEDCARLNLGYLDPAAVNTDEWKDRETSFLAALELPRRIMMMVPAGKPVDAAIASLKPHLAQGDLLIDGGNTFFLDTERRSVSWKQPGHHLHRHRGQRRRAGRAVGASHHARRAARAWELVKPIFRSHRRPVSMASPAWPTWGPRGAGHYVKMVHNGIEYGDMQLIAEAYDLLHRGLG
jgi:hypothetical protein